MGSRQPALASRPVSGMAFFGTAAVLFAAAAAVTVTGYASMRAMPGISVWLPARGHAWPGTAAAFLGMWIAMMVAMMLPSLVPVLWRWRQATLRPGGISADRLALWIGTGYFAIWALCGMGVFALGATLTMLGRKWPLFAHAAPLAGGAVILAAGASQFTAWKTRHLACCRQTPACGEPPPTDTRSAWRCGRRLGLHCVQCCAGPTAALLVVGVMDLRAMAVATAAISAERLAPAGGHVARFTGALAIGAGLFVVVRAVGWG